MKLSLREVGIGDQIPI